LLRVGFLADFLSRSVLIGFLTGVGIHIAWQQLPKMLGVASVQSDLASISWATAGLSAAIVSFVVVSRFISKRIPAALIAIIASIVLGAIGNLSSHGVELLGSVPSGLPKFGFPHGAWSAMPHLWGIAGAMFLVILAQSAGTASAYANRYRESVDENRDLLALGLSNIAAGFTGTFVVNGSPTKSEMVDDAGGRSQLAMLSTAGVVVIVLLALTRPLEFLPTAALASVVFMIGVGLIDVAGLRQVLQMRRNEFFVAFITMLTVVFVGIEQGVVLAMILSVINHLRRSYRPNDTVLTLGADGHLHAVPLHDGVPISPGVVVYHFSASIYFANAERFRNEVLALSGIDGGAIKIVVIDASGIADIDYSGGQMMLELVEQLAERDVRMVIANAPADVRREFIIYGVADLLGENSNFETVSSALRAFRNN
ncbi:MAG: STAS domain-containing protein, partial [Actinobacteria bacterium]|nr:STAS domain-containing protein [Actinomycetota bacterium]